MRGSGKEREEEEEEEEKGISKLLVSIMGGYSDSVIPPLTEFSPVPRTAIVEMGSSSGKRCRPKSTESIQKERERRDKMAEMFTVLQTFVPNLLPKATREKIVAGTIQYIASLEKERERLERLKESLPAREALTRCTNPNSAVDVTVSGNGVVFFGIQLVSRPHLSTEIFEVFEKHEAEVLAANVSVDGGHHHQRRRLAVNVTAMVESGNGGVVEKIRKDLLNL